MITPLDVVFQAQRGDHGADVIVDRGRLAGAVDPAHEPVLVVVGLEGGRLLVVDGQPVLDHLGAVVVALDEARSVLIADALVLGRIELDVVVVAGLDADPPAGESP
jgi:hypothetical protein